MEKSPKPIEVVKRRSSTTPAVTITSSECKKEIVQNTILSILRNMLKKPELTKVSYRVGEKTTVFEIDTVQEDFGRIIGASGRNISALRTLVLAMSLNFGFRAVIEIKDEEQYFNK